MGTSFTILAETVAKLGTRELHYCDNTLCWPAYQANRQKIMNTDSRFVFTFAAIVFSTRTIIFQLGAHSLRQDWHTQADRQTDTHIELRYAEIITKLCLIRHYPLISKLCVQSMAGHDTTAEPAAELDKEITSTSSSFIVTVVESLFD